MNRSIAALVVCLLCVGAQVWGNDAPVHFGQTSVVPSVADQGTSIAVTLPFTCADGWRYLAYSVGAYRPYVPNACAADTGPWPLSESKHGREWDSFQIRTWTWHSRTLPPPSALEISLDTTDWPPGDYRLHVRLLVRNEALPEDRGDGTRDRYLQRNILLSIVAP